MQSIKKILESKPSFTGEDMYKCVM
jgi:hypothetical protein